MAPELKLKIAEFVGAFSVEVMDSGAVAEARIDKDGEALYVKATIEKASHVYVSEYAVDLRCFGGSSSDAAWLGAQQGKRTGRELAARQ